MQTGGHASRQMQQDLVTAECHVRVRRKLGRQRVRGVCLRQVGKLAMLLPEMEATLGKNRFVRKRMNFGLVLLSLKF